MERAKTFEAAAGNESNHSSRNQSRAGSVARGRRSPSVGRQLAEHWNQAVERSSRPSSRGPTEEPRNVGRVDTSAWETRNQSAPAAPPKTPPPKRRELAAPSPLPREEAPPVSFPREKVLDNVQWPPSRPESRAAARTPEPPPRKTYAANTVREDNLLNQASIQLLSARAEEAKEQSVEEWVRQTSQQYQEDIELEKFAHDIAETVVSNLEKQHLTEQKVIRLAAVVVLQNSLLEKSNLKVAPCFTRKGVATNSIKHKVDSLCLIKSGNARSICLILVSLESF